MQTLQEEDELAKLEVVLLPRPKFPPSLRRGYVKLHVLDLLIGLTIGQDIGLSACDLPVSDKGPPYYCGASEDSPSTGPPLGDLKL